MCVCVCVCVYERERERVHGHRCVSSARNERDLEGSKITVNHLTEKPEVRLFTNNTVLFRQVYERDKSAFEFWVTII